MSCIYERVVGPTVLLHEIVQNAERMAHLRAGSDYGGWKAEVKNFINPLRQSINLKPIEPAPLNWPGCQTGLENNS